MAIWSLTQERVEKLLKQVGDKEEEIDVLIKLSPKDLWNADLEAFVEEWNTQLLDEEQRMKKLKNMGRRASQKLGIGASKGGKSKKKRKMGDSDSEGSDSEFGPVKKKAKPKKDGLLDYLRQDEPVKKPTAAQALKSSSAFGTSAPQKQGTLLAHLSKKDTIPNLDGESDSADIKPDPAPAPKRAAAKAVKKPSPVIDSDDDDDSDVQLVPEPAPKRGRPAAAAAAARKPSPVIDSGDDSDVQPVPAPAKRAAAKVTKKPSPIIDSDDDSDVKPVPAPAKRAPAKVTKKPSPIEDSDDNTDVFVAVAKEAEKKKPAATATGRAARGAAKPVSKYAMDDSDSDSDGDDMLGDVSSMVKTIGAGSNGVPMFKTTSNVRPGSGTGSHKIAKKASPSLVEIDDDETNYEGLMPQRSPKRSGHRNINDTIMSSDVDDYDIPAKKPVVSKLTAKVAPKPKAAPKAKPAAPAKAEKPATKLSPAAKVYSSRLEKSKPSLPPPKTKKPAAPVDSDEEMEDADKLANDILSDSEDEPTPKPKPAARAAAARPGRRAAAQPAKYVVSDDDSGSEEASEASFDDDSE
jgi:DNA topoisomerase-2